MRLMHLQLLLSIAQTGSLRAAADALHVSQPALTKALQQLEEEFGTTLVHRSPRGARLAQAGELLAARAALALRELDRAREEVAWHVERTHASLAIGVSPAAATMLVPSTIARFTARCAVDSSRWCRRTAPSRGSTDRRPAGNTYCQPGSRAAAPSLRASASGSQTCPNPAARSRP